VESETANENSSTITPDTKQLIVGTALCSDTLIILPRSIVQYLGNLYTGLGSSTWGELRYNSTTEIYKEVLDQAGYGALDDFLSKLDVGMPVAGARVEALRVYAERAGEPLPSDDTPFDPGRDIGSYGDCDFPPAPQLLMLEHMPKDIVERFGNVYETIFNGTFVDFASDQRDEIVAELERIGYDCIEDQALIDHVQRE
jgi:hypothetical protein